ncbi:MAG: amidohydrolase family protein [Acidimicrobiia bacterium]
MEEIRLVVDVHAHLTPQRYKNALRTGQTWHGLDGVPGELGLGGFDRSVAERIADLDRDGVDLQLISPTAGFYQYANELATTKVIARECNDEIAETVSQHPTRFAGLATLPMQDPSSAIAELERAMAELKLKGAMISDHVAGRTYDEPEFLPFFQAAEAMGAIVFFHQGGDTVVNHRIRRFKLGNAVGNMTERALVFGALVFGGIMDSCPDLKVLLAHGGGYIAYGIARMDKVAGALEGNYQETGRLEPPFGPDPFSRLTRPPSDYLRRFSYDCCTYSGPALRYLIDAVGIDRVMLGTDAPAPMQLKDPVNWVMGLPELTAEEKTAILSTNPTAFLGLPARITSRATPRSGMTIRGRR